MCCDYYVQTELVIEFIDCCGSLSKTKTNRIIEPRYLTNMTDIDKDDLEKYKHWCNNQIKYDIDKNTYKKIIYCDNNWLKQSYKKKYLKQILLICPRMVGLVRVYENYTAWKHM